VIGYCTKCKEYRSDNGKDAWGFVWKKGVPICNRCGHFVDLFDNDRYVNIKRNFDHLNSLYRYVPKLNLRKVPYPLRKSTKRCWKCGASVFVEDRICPFCGARLNAINVSDGKPEKYPGLVVLFNSLIQRLEKMIKRKRRREKEKS